MFAVGLLLTMPVPAQGENAVALVGGRLIDGYGHAPIADSVILIKGERIVQVGTVETLEVPDGFDVISLEGMDVLPGLWEAHAHLM
ncbi:MAG: Xaa-Pro dipeptidase, partial [Cyanobacteria bacterium J06648_11]